MIPINLYECYTLKTKQNVLGITNRNRVASIQLPPLQLQETQDSIIDSEISRVTKKAMPSPVAADSEQIYSADIPWKGLYLLVTLLYSSNYSIFKYINDAVPDVSASTIVATRFSIAAVIISPWLFPYLRIGKYYKMGRL